MSRIKSAYELATERIIISRYNPPVYEDNRVDLESEKDIKLDYVHDWKNPNREEHKDIDFIENNSPVKRKEEDFGGLKIQESKTYHFEDKEEVKEVFKNICKNYKYCIIS